jgi:cation transport regulator
VPYSSNSTLPSSVRDNLPEHAQSIYREAFNSGYEQTHNESRSARIGWAAVSNSYKKRNGRWVKRDAAD